MYEGSVISIVIVLLVILSVPVVFCHDTCAAVLDKRSWKKNSAHFVYCVSVLPRAGGVQVDVGGWETP
jgi:hypothetical protein